MEERRANEFAKQIYGWNKTQSYLYTMALILLGSFIAILANVIAVDYRNLLMEGSGLWKVAGIWLCIGILFPVLFCQLHVLVPGKEGQIRQSVADILAYQPFSMETYFQVLKRKYRVVGGVLISIVTWVLIIGAFFRVDVQETEDETSYELQSVLKPEVLFPMLAVVMLAIVIFVLASEIVFRIYQNWLQTKMEHPDRRGKAKERKAVKTRNGVWSGRNIVWLFVISIISTIIITYVIDWLKGIHVPQDYTREWMLTQHTTIFCSAIQGMVVYLFMIFVEKRKLAKKVVVICVLIVGYTATFYNCYYEDSFRVHTLWKDTTYTWSDVKSYTVSGSFMLAGVQLELQMEDDKVKVFAMETTKSIRHTEQYLTDYHYVLALMEKMDAYGIPGTIRNGEKLEKYANERWEEERAEVLQVVENMKEIAEVE